MNNLLGTIGHYTTSGATVNASLISGLIVPWDIAVAPIPEPETYAMMLAGLSLMGFVARSRKQKDAINPTRQRSVSSISFVSITLGAMFDPKAALLLHTVGAAL